MGDLTQQEEVFLEALFDESLNPDGCPEKAKMIAGYKKSDSVIKIIRKIKDTYQDDMQNYFLSSSVKAGKKIVNLLEAKNPPPNSDKVLSAAIQILDRAGVTKKDKQEVEVKVPEGIIVLPALNDDE